MTRIKTEEARTFEITHSRASHESLRVIDDELQSISCYSLSCFLINSEVQFGWKTNKVSWIKRKKMKRNYTIIVNLQSWFVLCFSMQHTISDNSFFIIIEFKRHFGQINVLLPRNKSNKNKNKNEWMNENRNKMSN